MRERSRSLLAVVLVLSAPALFAAELPLTGATVIDGAGGPPRVPHDLERMLGCGLTPAVALAAATANGTRLLGIEGRTGRIAEGLEADAIVVDRTRCRT